MNGSWVMAKIVGDAVDGKHQVGQFDQYQCQKQRGGITQRLAVPGRGMAYEEVRAMDLVGNPHVPPHELEDRVVGQVWATVFLRQRHFHPGKQQEGTEDVKHPGKVLYQRRAHADHDGPQEHHAQDAPEQNAVLVAAGMAK